MEPLLYFYFSPRGLIIHANENLCCLVAFGLLPFHLSFHMVKIYTKKQIGLMGVVEVINELLGEEHQLP
jgi:hypothetical protein